LSIDFDFFQKVKKDTILECYPDGIDLPSALSELVWASHYASQGKYLREVTINKTKLNEIKNILKKQNRDVPVMIAQSHVSAYDFIKENAGDKACDIVNIDMHHDMFNNNENLDCGNWIGHIMKDIKGSTITWIANRISKSTYGLTQVDDLIRTDFREIKDRKFDLIFLCRSDNWIPPHLDIYFYDIYKTMRSHFNELIVQNDVLTIRDCNSMINNFSKMMRHAG
jgi:hypothetical protein